MPASDPEVAPAAPAPLPGEFSGQRALAHEEALSAFGPRERSSPAEQALRGYLTRELVGQGARVWEIREGSARHLMAEIEGRSPDQILLVAPLSLVSPDEWIGDSAASLLVELARSLGSRRPLYTIRVALAETREAGSGEASSKLRVETPSAARRRVAAAGESLARALAGAESSSRAVLRGVIVFDAPARPDLRFAKDIRSHPIFRDVFWSAAAELGFSRLFPPDAGWSSPNSLHLGLEGPSDGKILALVDESWTRPEVDVAPRVASSAETFEQSGRVTLAALDRLMRRFARIDAFGQLRPPLREPAASPPQTSPDSP